MRQARGLVFAALALIAAVAGCGSEPDGSVKVGFIVAGERPTYLRSAQLAVDEINASGGLLGARRSNW